MTYTAPTIAELIRLAIATSTQPRFGPAWIEDDNQCRWLDGDTPMPAHGRFGEAFYDRTIHSPDLGKRIQEALERPILGWLFAAPGWYVEDPWPAIEGRLAEHPRRLHAQHATWVDQDTGTATTTIYIPHGDRTITCEHPRPAEGHHPDDVGTLIAAIDLLRTSATNIAAAEEDPPTPG